MIFYHFRTEKICQLGAGSFIANSLIGPSFVSGPKRQQKSHNGNLQYQSQICVKCFVLGEREFYSWAAAFFGSDKLATNFYDLQYNLNNKCAVHPNALAKRFLEGIVATAIDLLPLRGRQQYFLL